MAEQLKQDIENLTLENRSKLNLTCVEVVESFSEQTLKLNVSGSKVSIFGQGLKILSFNKGTGSLSAEGDIREIRYEHKKQPIMKRIFK